MKGIRGRITMTYVVLMVMALFISGLFSLKFIEQVYMEKIRDGLINEAKIVAGWVSPLMAAPNANLQQIFKIADTVSESTKKRITIYDRTGDVLYDTDLIIQRGSEEGPEVAEALHKKTGTDIRLDERMETNSLYVAVPVNSGNEVYGVIRASILLPGVYGELRGLWVNVASGLFLIAGVSSLIGFYFASGISRPIEEITKVTRRIASGAFHERVRYRRQQDELTVLGESVNLMATRLADQIEDLIQEKSKLEGVLSHMDSGVMVVDRAGRIQVVNQATEGLLRHKGKALLGQWHWEVGRSYGLSTLIDEVLELGESKRAEITLNTPVETIVELYATPIKGKNHSIVGAVVVLHDVSKWRRVEQMRTEFVANVSHELRTPITAVRGFAETLLDGAMEDPDMRRQFIRIIFEESDRLSRLVNDLLDLSKIESGHSVLQFERCDMNELVDKTVHKLSNEAIQQGLILQAHVPEESIIAEVARDRVAQVLINLIGNAIAYTPEGGRIDVFLEESQDKVIVRVRDTGIGIPREDLHRLFERFYRVDKARARRSGGTGLGLAIVKHIVEAHRGVVHVDSTLGKGSTFSFILPKEQKSNAE